MTEKFKVSTEPDDDFRHWPRPQAGQEQVLTEQAEP
jgi:hypothetical protein